MLGEHTDDQLREALAKVGMLEAVDAEGGLECQVAEFGENFSVGQVPALVEFCFQD